MDELDNISKDIIVSMFYRVQNVNGPVGEIQNVNLKHFITGLKKILEDYDYDQINVAREILAGLLSPNLAFKVEKATLVCETYLRNIHQKQTGTQAALCLIQNEFQTQKKKEKKEVEQNISKLIDKATSKIAVEFTTNNAIITKKDVEKWLQKHEILTN